MTRLSREERDAAAKVSRQKGQTFRSRESNDDLDDELHEPVGPGDELEADDEPAGGKGQKSIGEQRRQPFETARAWVMRIAAGKWQYHPSVIADSRAALRKELADLAALPASSFGDRVRALRPRTGLTQAGLAHRAGLPIAALREIECNERDPDAVELVKLARALDCDLEAFGNVTRGARRAVRPKAPGEVVGAAGSGG